MFRNLYGGGAETTWQLELEYAAPCQGAAAADPVASHPLVSRAATPNSAAGGLAAAAAAAAAARASLASPPRSPPSASSAPPPLRVEVAWGQAEEPAEVAAKLERAVAAFAEAHATQRVAARLSFANDGGDDDDAGHSGDGGGDDDDGGSGCDGSGNIIASSTTSSSSKDAPCGVNDDDGGGGNLAIPTTAGVLPGRARALRIRGGSITAAPGSVVTAAEWQPGEAAAAAAGFDMATGVEGNGGVGVSHQQQQEKKQQQHKQQHKQQKRQPRVVRLSLELGDARLALRGVVFRRTAGSAAASEAAVTALLAALDARGVARIRLCDGVGFAANTIAAAPAAWASLTALALGGCGLAALPPGLGELQALRVLRVGHNKLTALPPELGRLSALEVLAAEANQLTSVPAELHSLTALRDLDLSNNARLSRLVLDLAPLRALTSLHLAGCPLEYVPELAPATALRSLSLGNVRVLADATMARFDVEVGPAPPPAGAGGYGAALLATAGVGGGPPHRLAPFFSLVLKRPAVHPVLAGALAHLTAQDRTALELLSRDGVALQQVVAMAMSDDARTARPACRMLCALCGAPSAHGRLLRANAPRAVESLLASPQRALRAAGLEVLAALARGAPPPDIAAARPPSWSSQGRNSSSGGGAKAAAAAAVADELVPPPVLERVIELARCDGDGGGGGDGNGGADSGDDCGGANGVRCRCLDALTALSYNAATARRLRESGPLMALLADLASSGQSTAAAASKPPADGGPRGDARLHAIRLLAALGQNEAVRIALGRPPIGGGGVRVLAMDGGGMKGMAMVEILREIERRAGGRPIHELFDVIGGTSTGALLAVAIGVMRLPLARCGELYTFLGKRVFQQSAAPASSAAPATTAAAAAASAGASSASKGAPATAAAAAVTTAAAAAAADDAGDDAAGWRGGLSRLYASGSNSVRLAVYGAKHDAAPYEELLREHCRLGPLGAAGDALIDAAALGGPAVFAAATLASVKPATPFVFRNYELPPEAGADAIPGSSRYAVWQAVRASSAAPYYFDDFSLDGLRFQDGATTANNPAALALQQARLLYPDAPVSVLVSLGCGSGPREPRGRGMHSVVDAGAVLVEAACSTERVHEALAAALPLAPGLRYLRLSPDGDARCSMALDAVDPAAWRRLLAAAREYCAAPATAAALDELSAALVAGAAAGGASLPTAPRGLADGGGVAALNGGDKGAAAAAAAAPRVGTARGVVLIEAPRGAHAHGAVEAGAEAAARVAQLVRRCVLDVEEEEEQQEAGDDDDQQQQQHGMQRHSASWPFLSVLQQQQAQPGTPPTPPKGGRVSGSGGASAAAATMVDGTTASSAAAAPPSSWLNRLLSVGSGLGGGGSGGGGAGTAKDAAEGQPESLATEADGSGDGGQHHHHDRGAIARSRTVGTLRTSPPSPPHPTSAGGGDGHVRPSPAAAAARASAAALTAVTDALQAAAGRAGVVHLALHATDSAAASGGGALVAGWQSRVVAVVEPSAEADALAARLAAPTGRSTGGGGSDAGADDGGGGGSLSRALAGRACVELAGGALLTVLSQQRMRAGTRSAGGNSGGGGGSGGASWVTSWVLELIEPRPGALIDAAALAPRLARTVVVSAGRLPAGFAAAALRAGARAVVAPRSSGGDDGDDGSSGGVVAIAANDAHGDHGSSSSSSGGGGAAAAATAAQVTAFFGALYSALLDEALSVPAAIAAAERREPALRGAFGCYALA